MCKITFQNQSVVCTTEQTRTHLYRSTATDRDEATIGGNEAWSDVTNSWSIISQQRKWIKLMNSEIKS